MFIMYRILYKLCFFTSVCRINIQVFRRFVKPIDEIIELIEGKVECLAVEVRLCNEKWIILSVYKKPKTKNDVFIRSNKNLLYKCIIEQCNVIVCGDMNIDVLKTNCLQDVLEVQGFKNIVTKPTCYKSTNNTLIDLVLTNVHKRFKNVDCILNELSDFHHRICWSTKLHYPWKINRMITYRSYKRFDETKFTNDMSLIPHHVGEIFDDVDDSFWFVYKLSLGVMNEHAPIKKTVH